MKILKVQITNAEAIDAYRRDKFLDNDVEIVIEKPTIDNSIADSPSPEDFSYYLRKTLSYVPEKIGQVIMLRMLYKKQGLGLARAKWIIENPEAAEDQYNTAKWTWR